MGRALTYVVLAGLLVAGMRATVLADLLGRWMNQILGPILVLIAMLLLELIRFRWSGPRLNETSQQRVQTWGVWAALPLGVVFAMAFCPISAGVFFITLLAILTEHRSPILLPSLYGVGTALPVAVFAVLILFSAQAVGKTFNAMSWIERWFRRVAGILILAIGIHCSLKYTIGWTPSWDPESRESCKLFGGDAAFSCGAGKLALGGACLLRGHSRGTDQRNS